MASAWAFVSAGVVLFSALVFVVLFAVIRGWGALWNVNFFTQTMQFAGPRLRASWNR